MDSIAQMQEKLRRMAASAENDVRIGFDLGTSCSVLAYKREQNSFPEAIFGIRSLVWIKKDGTRLAGNAVEKAHALEIDPEGVCESPKMRLHEKEIILHGKAYPPAEILEILLETIRDTYKEELHRRNVSHFSKMVVGRPNRYQGDEIGTLFKLLKKVYPDVDIRLVPEAILAAVGYRAYTMDVDRPLLDVDHGAGTFDVSYLIKNPNFSSWDPYPFKVGKTIEGSRFAGDEIDKLTADLILKQLEREYGAAELKTLRTKGHADRAILLYKARAVKEALSFSESERVLLTTVSGNTFTTVVTRAQFEKAITPGLQKNVDLAYQVLQAENPGTPDVDILMVGASSYIPLVKKLLMKKFYWLSEDRFLLREPEKAVALGAAICCDMPNIVNETPVAYAYGVMTYIVAERKDKIHCRIPSGVSLPFETQAYYSTRFEGQTSVAFQVYELDRGKKDELFDVEDCRPTEYGIEHQFGKAVPVGTQVQLTVRLDQNGMLTLKVDDLGITKRPTERVVTIPNTARV